MNIGPLEIALLIWLGVTIVIFLGYWSVGFYVRTMVRREFSISKLSAAAFYALMLCLFWPMIAMIFIWLASHALIDRKNPKD